MQRLINTALVLLVTGLGYNINGQTYDVGETLDTSLLDAPPLYCANAPQEATLRQLLDGADGSAPRAVWMSFFATW